MTDQASFPNQSSPKAPPEPSEGELSPSLATSGDLLRHLREADGATLTTLVSELGDEISAPQAKQVLRNPFAGEEVLRSLVDQDRLLRIYELRRLFARHPKLPPALALKLIPGLFWRDLMEVGLDTRIKPVVRRSAQRYLVERLPSLAVGERVTLARRASPSALVQLRRDPHRAVIAALLENTRLTEATLMPMIASASTLPQVLELVAANRRWGARYAIRQTIAKNPKTPVGVTLRLLPLLKKPDQKAIAANANLATVVRQRARVLLGG